MVIFNKFSIDIHCRMITVLLYSLTRQYHKCLVDLDITPAKGLNVIGIYFSVITWWGMILSRVIDTWPKVLGSISNVNSQSLKPTG